MSEKLNLKVKFGMVANETLLRALRAIRDIVTRGMSLLHPVCEKKKKINPIKIFKIKGDLELLEGRHKRYKCC